MQGQRLHWWKVLCRRRVGDGSTHCSEHRRLARLTRRNTPTSPSNAEIEMWSISDLGMKGDREIERFRRRGVAIEEVTCQQSGKQRSTVARSKRSASELAAPHSKRMCDGLDAPKLNRSPEMHACKRIPDRGPDPGRDPD